MTATTAKAARALVVHRRGMAVGLASGLAGIAFTALLPDAVADVVIGLPLLAGWVL